MCTLSCICRIYAFRCIIHLHVYTMHMSEDMQVYTHYVFSTRVSIMQKVNSNLVEMYVCISVCTWLEIEPHM